MVSNVDCCVGVVECESCCVVGIWIFVCDEYDLKNILVLILWVVWEMVYFVFLIFDFINVLCWLDLEEIWEIIMDDDVDLVVDLELYVGLEIYCRELFLYMGKMKW